ncbi:hypothetical protein [Bradyrhizobium brasilense]|uniref:hypothetical protein n=1 Tax=Bradyrhizobium brasilense TaxID=1419277 RepID=UPI00115FF2F2|nr:hypothetical protein [Bradyrhizobium brasilense]
MKLTGARFDMSGNVRRRGSRAWRRAINPGEFLVTGLESAMDRRGLHAPPAMPSRPLGPGRLSKSFTRAKAVAAV